MMRALGWLSCLAPCLLAACSSSSSPAAPADGGDSTDGATATDAGADGGPPAKKIEHLVVIVQENHTFDTYFGRYCTAPTGSNPTCTNGPSCCEAGPATEPGGASPVVLDDAANGNYDPDHEQTCETAEINGGKMDGFVAGASCADRRNFAYADPALVKPYTDLAAAGALADRYFQPLIGQSSSNDMYLARAAYVFTDNQYAPEAAGSQCKLGATRKSFTEQTIADLLVAKGVSWAWYGEGYKAMLDAMAANAQNCPAVGAECGTGLSSYPCVYDPGDVPFQYYPTLKDNPTYMRDFTQLATDLKGSFPSVAYVKAIGYRSEHPGYLDTISAGITFVKGVIDAVNASPVAATTLILLTYDEGGGFFDHVAPPANTAADGKPYGTRIPLLAIGPFARKNTVSHVVMEHSSIVKFIEWNWLGSTGQLGTRDKDVANIGSLIEPAAVTVPVPEN